MSACDEESDLWDDESRSVSPFTFFGAHSSIAEESEVRPFLPYGKDIPGNRNAPQVETKQLLRSLLGAAMGNLLEWFDFAIFGLLAAEIGNAFFPKGSSVVHMLEVFSLFAGAFFVRPLGGALFGYIGDRFGRLYALRTSILMMAVPTLAMGVCPTYDTIGISATIVVIVLRLIQGISVGGEVGGSLTYVLEVCPPDKRNLFGQLVMVSGSGTLLASAVNAILRASLTNEQMETWGWRLPFFGGLLVAMAGLSMRRGLEDSRVFQEMQENGDVSDNPTKDVIKSHKLEMASILGVLCYGSFSWYTIFVWMPNYLSNTQLRDHPVKNPYLINVVAISVTSLAALYSGYLADHWDRRNMMLAFGCMSCLTAMLTVPLLAHLQDELMICGIMCLLGFLLGMYYGPIPTFVVDCMSSPQVKVSGTGLAWNVASACFGGSAPLMATFMVKNFGVSALGYMMAGAAAITLTCVLALPYLQSWQQRDKYAPLDHV